MKFETVSTIKSRKSFEKLFSLSIFLTIIDVLVNLTDLERLDISYNKISTFLYESNISFPRNLSHLYASNNKLYDISSVVFNDLTAAELIDVRSNNIQTIEPDLLNKVKTGLQLFISGIYKQAGFLQKKIVGRRNISIKFAHLRLQ